MQTNFLKRLYSFNQDREDTLIEPAIAGLFLAEFLQKYNLTWQERSFVIENAQDISIKLMSGFESFVKQSDKEIEITFEGNNLLDGIFESIRDDLEYRSLANNWEKLGQGTLAGSSEYYDYYTFYGPVNPPQTITELLNFSKTVLDDYLTFFQKRYQNDFLYDASEIFFLRDMVFDPDSGGSSIVLIGRPKDIDVLFSDKKKEKEHDEVKRFGVKQFEELAKRASTNLYYYSNQSVQYDIDLRKYAEKIEAYPGFIDSYVGQQDYKYYEVFFKSFRIVDFLAKPSNEVVARDYEVISRENSYDQTFDFLIFNLQEIANIKKENMSCEDFLQKYFKPLPDDFCPKDTFQTQRADNLIGTAEDRSMANSLSSQRESCNTSPERTLEQQLQENIALTKNTILEDIRFILDAEPRRIDFDEIVNSGKDLVVEELLGLDLTNIVNSFFICEFGTDLSCNGVIANKILDTTVEDVSRVRQISASFIETFTKDTGERCSQDQKVLDGFTFSLKSQTDKIFQKLINTSIDEKLDEDFNIEGLETSYIVSTALSLMSELTLKALVDDNVSLPPFEESDFDTFYKNSLKSYLKLPVSDSDVNNVQDLLIEFKNHTMQKINDLDLYYIADLYYEDVFEFDYQIIKNLGFRADLLIEFDRSIKEYLQNNISKPSKDAFNNTARQLLNAMFLRDQSFVAEQTNKIIQEEYNPAIFSKRQIRNQIDQTFSDFTTYQEVFVHVFASYTLFLFENNQNVLSLFNAMIATIGNIQEFFESYLREQAGEIQDDALELYRIRLSELERIYREEIRVLVSRLDSNRIRFNSKQGSLLDEFIQISPSSPEQSIQDSEILFEAYLHSIENLDSFLVSTLSSMSIDDFRRVKSFDFEAIKSRITETMERMRQSFDVALESFKNNSMTASEMDAEAFLAFAGINPSERLFKPVSGSLRNVSNEVEFCFDSLDFLNTSFCGNVFGNPFNFRMPFLPYLPVLNFSFFDPRTFEDLFNDLLRAFFRDIRTALEMALNVECEGSFQGQLDLELPEILDAIADVIRRNANQEEFDLEDYRDEVEKFFDDLANKFDPLTLCQMFGGSSNTKIISLVLRLLEEKYPILFQFVNTPELVREFLMAAGLDFGNETCSDYFDVFDRVQSPSDIVQRIIPKGPNCQSDLDEYRRRRLLDAGLPEEEAQRQVDRLNNNREDIKNNIEDLLDNPINEDSFDNCLNDRQLTPSDKDNLRRTDSLLKSVLKGYEDLSKELGRTWSSLFIEQSSLELTVPTKVRMSSLGLNTTPDKEILNPVVKNLVNQGADQEEIEKRDQTKITVQQNKILPEYQDTINSIGSKTFSRQQNGDLLLSLPLRDSKAVSLVLEGSRDISYLSTDNKNQYSVVSEEYRPFFAALSLRSETDNTNFQKAFSSFVLDKGNLIENNDIRKRLEERSYLSVLENLLQASVEDLQNSYYLQGNQNFDKITGIQQGRLNLEQIELFQEKEDVCKKQDSLGFERNNQEMMDVAVKSVCEASNNSNDTIFSKSLKSTGAVQYIRVSIMDYLLRCIFVWEVFPAQQLLDSSFVSYIKNKIVEDVSLLPIERYNAYRDSINELDLESNDVVSRTEEVIEKEFPFVFGNFKSTVNLNFVSDNPLQILLEERLAIVWAPSTVQDQTLFASDSSLFSDANVVDRILSGDLQNIDEVISRGKIQKQIISSDLYLQKYYRVRISEDIDNSTLQEINALGILDLNEANVIDRYDMLRILTVAELTTPQIELSSLFSEASYGLRLVYEDYDSSLYPNALESNKTERSLLFKKDEFEKYYIPLVSADINFNTVRSMNVRVIELIREFDSDFGYSDFVQKSLIQILSKTRQIDNIFNQIIPVKQIDSLIAVHCLSFVEESTPARQYWQPLKDKILDTILHSSEEYMRRESLLPIELQDENSVAIDQGRISDKNDLGWRPESINPLAQKYSSFEGVRFAFNAVKAAGLTLFKNYVETTDPNIAVASRIHYFSNRKIPVFASSIGQLPVNVIPPPFGIGPPITPAGFAYLALFGFERDTEDRNNISNRDQRRRVTEEEKQMLANKRKNECED